MDSNTGNHYGNRSLLTIELMFHDVPGLAGHFEIDHSRPEKFTRFVSNKVKFAKDIVPTLADDHFKPFAPIFDFIEAKIV